MDDFKTNFIGSLNELSCTTYNYKFGEKYINVICSSKN